MPARTTTLLWNISGLHAIPSRGAKPHCRPVSVELLTPFLGYRGLLPATMKPLEVTVPVASVKVVERWIEIVDSSVLFCERTIPVVTQAKGHVQVREHLIAVLNVQAGLPSAQYRRP